MNLKWDHEERERDLEGRVGGRAHWRSCDTGTDVELAREEGRGKSNIKRVHKKATGKPSNGGATHERIS